MDANRAARYDAFTDLPAQYDSVPLYAGRRDIAFNIAEAEAAGGTVLELGCGTGRVLLPIARRGTLIEGLDSSRSMLERCRCRLDKSGGSDPNVMRMTELLPTLCPYGKRA